MLNLEYVDLMITKMTLEVNGCVFVHAAMR